jgi:hypothetical protein
VTAHPAANPCRAASARTPGPPPLAAVQARPSRAVTFTRLAVSNRVTKCLTLPPKSSPPNVRGSSSAKYQQTAKDPKSMLAASSWTTVNFRRLHSSPVTPVLPQPTVAKEIVHPVSVLERRVSRLATRATPFRARRHVVPARWCLPRAPFPLARTKRKTVTKLWWTVVARAQSAPPHAVTRFKTATKLVWTAGARAQPAWLAILRNPDVLVKRNGLLGSLVAKARPSAAAITMILRLGYHAVDSTATNLRPNGLLKGCPGVPYPRLAKVRCGNCNPRLT